MRHNSVKKFLHQQLVVSFFFIYEINIIFQLISGAVETPVDAFLFLGVTLCACSVAVLALCFWCHRKRRRRRRQLSQLRRGPESISHLGSSRRQLSSAPGSIRHVCDEAGERFASVDSVWSIVETHPFAIFLIHRFSDSFSWCLQNKRKRINE